MKKLIGITFFILLLLCFLLYTSPGTALFFAAANRLIPGLNIQKSAGVSYGTLANSIKLNLRYQNQDYLLAIDGLKLDWQPYALLNKHLIIHDLRYKHLLYRQLRNTSSSDWYKKFKFDIENASLSTTQIQLNQKQKPITFVSATLYQEDSKHSVLSWVNLAYPIDQSILFQSPTGSAQLQGDRRHYTITIQADIQGKNVPTGLWQIQGYGSSNGIELTQIYAKLIRNDLTGYAKIQWYPIWNWQLALHNQQNSLDSQGQLQANQWSANWQFHIPDIASIIPNTSGSIYSKGNVTGPKATPLIHSVTMIKNLQLADYHTAKLESKLDLNLNDLFPSSIKLSAQAIKFKTIYLDSLEIIGKGFAKQHALDIALNSSRLTMHANLTGNYTNQIWQGLLTQNTWQLKNYGKWSLERPTHLRIAAQQIAISQTSWQGSKQQRLTIQGIWKSKDDWNLSLQAKQMLLKNLQSVLPTSIQLSGLIDIDLKANQANQAALEMQIYPSQITYRNAQAKQDLIIQSGHLLAQLTPRGLESKLKINFDQQQSLSGELLLPDQQGFYLPNAKQKIKGSLIATWQKLDLLSILWPKLHNLQGVLQGKIQLSGTIEHPQTLGIIQLQKAQTEVPSLGINIKNINITASGNPNGMINLQGEAQSGNGVLHIQGTTQASNLNTQLTLQGQNIQIFNTHDYQINASPQLKLDYANNQLKITGILFIPQARLTPSKVDRLSVPDDLVIVTAHKQTAESKLKFASDIQLLLGENIYGEIDGLRGKIIGKLFIHEPLDGLAIANGELNIIDGDYQAYGQTLTIRNGQLIFAGSPLTDPGLNIQAIRNVLDTQNRTSIFNANLLVSSNIVDHMVGVNVRGTLKNPRFNLFSEPADLSQTDILSYLVLGRPSSQANQADAQLLFQAASALSSNDTSGQLEHVKQQLQRGFGLDELNIASTPLQTGPTTLQNTSLILGKRLSPRLYIHYSIGLLEPINTLTIRYLLSSKWSLQTQANSIANSVDLFYSLERE